MLSDTKWDQDLGRHFFFFLGLHLQHLEVPRLGVTLELQPLAYTTATAHDNAGSLLNPLSKARDRTRVLMDPSWARYPLSHDGNSLGRKLKPLQVAQSWVPWSSSQLPARHVTRHRLDPPSWAGGGCQPLPSGLRSTPCWRRGQLLGRPGPCCRPDHSLGPAPAPGSGGTVAASPLPWPRAPCHPRL